MLRLTSRRLLLLLAGLAILLTVAAVGLAVSRGPKDACDGLSDEACMQLHAELSQKSQRYLIEFNEEIFPTLGLDVRTLPRAWVMATTLVEHHTMPEAARAAEIIARVRVEDVEFTAGLKAMTTVIVLEYWKGGGGPTMVIAQHSFVEQLDPSMPVYVGERKEAPFLAPGDEAVLFLKVTGRKYPDVIPWSGWYRVEGGTVRPPEYVVAASAAIQELDGITLPRLKARVDAALR